MKVEEYILTKIKEEVGRIVIDDSQLNDLYKNMSIEKVSNLLRNVSKTLKENNYNIYRCDEKYKYDGKDYVVEKTEFMVAIRKG